MKQTKTDMMALRRAAIDAMADRIPPPGEPFEGLRLDVADHAGDLRHGVPDGLVAAVAARLVRDGATAGPGAVVVGGLSRRLDPVAARDFHERLFGRVWDAVRAGDRPASGYRIKVNVTSDGAIPLELYGSRWSFKQLHMDRDALLFSHLYGPVTGFTGGSLVLADIRAYLARHRARFDDLFEWSDEATPGSKPVLRAEHENAVLAEVGLEVGPLGPDEIVFINNFPDSGVLHGVTPVAVTDRDAFVREYHRCSVKEVDE
jgi:hypothetical protein